MNGLRISRQFGVLMAIVTVSMAFVIGSLVMSKSSVIYAERYEALRMLTESAHSILSTYHQQELSGELTREEAQRRAFSAVVNVRYAPDGYFFGFDYDGANVFHINEALVGRDLSDLQDENGFYFLRDFIERGRAGGGVTTYPWAKPTDVDGDTYLKSAYNLAFEPWGIVVGTGVYIDDLQAQILRDTLTALSIAAAILLATAAAFFWCARGVSRGVVDARNALSAVADGDLETPPAHAHLKNEIGDISRAIIDLQGQLAGAEAQRAAIEAQRAEQAAIREAAEAERAEAARKTAEDAEALSDAMEAVGGVLSRMAKGDLTTRCGALAPRFDRLRGNLNEALAKLDEAMSRVRARGADIADAKGEIEQSSETLSKRTEIQAATLEETRAAIEELSASLHDTANSARDAASGAKDVSGEASDNVAIARDAVEAMRAIEESSSDIANMVAQIEGIAFQTNLLALNASVEAARVGDAGKGFAVVAQEVRELAQRSSTAAQQIGELVRNSSHRVASGVELVSRTGDSFARIVDRIEGTSQIVARIAEGATEQDSSLKTIKTSVAEIDDATQRNAVMAEETSASAATLGGDIAELAALLEAFGTRKAETRQAA